MRPRMRTTLLTSALGFSVALNLSLAIGLVLRAGPRGSGGEIHRAPSHRCLLEELDLSADQHESLSALRRAMRQRREEFWRRGATLKAELAEAICAPSPDRDRLAFLLDDFGQSQATMQAAVVDHLVNVNALLSPEQGERFRALLRTEVFRGMESATGTVEEP